MLHKFKLYFVLLSPFICVPFIVRYYPHETVLNYETTSPDLQQIVNATSFMYTIYIDHETSTMGRIREKETNETSTMGSVRERETKQTYYTILQPAEKYLNARRFDVIIKSVYAYFFLITKHVPKCIEIAYVEHLRVWNKFSEYCKDLDPRWSDYNKKCEEKKTKKDFITSFHRTMECIEKDGFDLSLSQIPLSKNEVIVDGAHRLATGVILSKEVYFQQLNYRVNIIWDFLFFQHRGLSTTVTDTVLMEWMKIQYKLKLLSQVSIISLFTDNARDATNIRHIVRHKLSRDGMILYEKSLMVKNLDISYLNSLIFANESIFGTTIYRLKMKVRTFRLNRAYFFFCFGKNKEEIIRNSAWKPDEQICRNCSVHILDKPESNLVLASMILNNDTLQYIYNKLNCTKFVCIAEKIAKSLPCR